MLKLAQQQHIRFATLEKPTAWVVVAVLVETRGEETVVISEPRIVKIIPKTKAELALPSSTSASSILALPSPYIEVEPEPTEIVSPYYTFFTYNDAGIIPSLSARPPTN